MMTPSTFKFVSCLIVEREVSKENLWSIYDTLAIADSKQEEALFFPVPSSFSNSGSCLITVETLPSNRSRMKGTRMTETKQINGWPFS